MFVFDFHCSFCLGNTTRALCSSITARGDSGGATKGVGAEHYDVDCFFWKAEQFSVSGVQNFD